MAHKSIKTSTSYDYLFDNKEFCEQIQTAGLLTVVAPDGKEWYMPLDAKNRKSTTGIRVQTENGTACGFSTFGTIVLYTKKGTTETTDKGTIWSINIYKVTISNPIFEDINITVTTDIDSIVINIPAGTTVMSDLTNIVHLSLEEGKTSYTINTSIEYVGGSTNSTSFAYYEPWDSDNFYFVIFGKYL